MQSVRYTVELSSPTLEEYCLLREKVGWGKVAPELAKASLNSSLFLLNSLISGDKAPTNAEINFYGTFNSGGNNLFGEVSKTSYEAIANLALVSTDINSTSDGDGFSTHVPTTLANIMNPLGDYGGPTQTHALVFNSPAVDASASDCTEQDQRGIDRDPNFCDIGAFEGAVAASASCFVIKAPNGNVLTFCL